MFHASDMDLDLLSPLSHVFLFSERIVNDIPNNSSLMLLKAISLLPFDSETLVTTVYMFYRSLHFLNRF
jgi:hypothetical protein